MSTGSKKPSGSDGLAAWKFTVLDTVDADPALKPACLSVMRVALGLMSTWDTKPFLPVAVLRKRTGGKAPATIIEARRLLIAEGYLTRDGTNDRGLDTFAISNPKREQIAALIEELGTKIKDEDTRRKLRQRERRDSRKANAEPAETSRANGAVISENEITKGDIGHPVISETESAVISETESVVISETEGNYVDGIAVDGNTVEGGGPWGPAASSTRSSFKSSSVDTRDNAKNNAPIDAPLKGATGACDAAKYSDLNPPPCDAYDGPEEPEDLIHDFVVGTRKSHRAAPSAAPSAAPGGAPGASSNHDEGSYWPSEFVLFQKFDDPAAFIEDHDPDLLIRAEPEAWRKLIKWIGRKYGDDAVKEATERMHARTLTIAIIRSFRRRAADVA